MTGRREGSTAKLGKREKPSTQYNKPYSRLIKTVRQIEKATNLPLILLNLVLQHQPHVEVDLLNLHLSFLAIAQAHSRISYSISFNFLRLRVSSIEFIFRFKAPALAGQRQLNNTSNCSVVAHDTFSVIVVVLLLVNK